MGYWGCARHVGRQARMGPGESQLGSCGLHPRPLGREAERVRSKEPPTPLLQGRRAKPLGHPRGTHQAGGVSRKPLPLGRARAL